MKCYEIRKINHITRYMYKLNLNVRRRNHVTFGTKSLKSLNSIPLNIKTAENPKLDKLRKLEFTFI